MVGVELVDILVSINPRVEELVPHVPMQHTFRGNGLQNFICNHQDHLEQLEDQLSNLVTMTENVVGRLSVANKSYHQDLHQVEWLNSELLVWVAALEHSWGNPIIIPDSLLPILIPASRSQLLVEIDNRVDDEVVQVITEDQAEGRERRRVTIEEVLRVQTSFSFFSRLSPKRLFICQHGLISYVIHILSYLIFTFLYLLSYLLRLSLTTHIRKRRSISKSIYSWTSRT